MATRWFADNIARLILCALVLFIWSIDYKTPGDFTFCLIKSLTGENCPGCGVLRGISAVMHLDLKSAYALNKMNIVIIPLLGYLFMRSWTTNRLS
jgi:Protein of unknown function (DUF2752)